MSTDRGSALSRILYLAGGSNGTGVYGAERSVLELVAGLDRARFQPCGAVTEGEGPYVCALRELGLPIADLRLGVSSRLSPKGLLANASGFVALLQVARKAGADLIHVNSLKVHHLAVLVGRALGLPVVCHVQGQVTPRSYFTRLAFAADRIVACSQAVAGPWRPLVAGDGRLRVLYYGLDPRPFAFSQEHRARERARLGLSDEAFVVGVVSRFSPEKGLEALFRSVAALGTTGWGPGLGPRSRGPARFVQGRPELRVVVAGDAPPCWREHGETIRQLPQHLGIAPWVMFLGYVRDIAPLYSAFDALVAPCPVEGLGRVILEAMAAGRPVIAIRAGGPAEVVVDTETGLLVEPEDCRALAAAMLRLAADRPLCRRLGEAGRRRIEERFTLAGFVRGFERVYEELLGGEKAPPIPRAGGA
jgi:glycosyltransferase involved in cell wall biosynthesis